MKKCLWPNLVRPAKKNIWPLVMKHRPHCAWSKRKFSHPSLPLCQYVVMHTCLLYYRWSEWIFVRHCPSWPSESISLDSIWWKESEKKEWVRNFNVIYKLKFFVAQQSKAAHLSGYAEHLIYTAPLTCAAAPPRACNVWELCELSVYIITCRG